MCVLKLNSTNLQENGQFTNLNGLLFRIFGYPNHARMENSLYSSQLLESAVGEFAKLPGIGRKTALRLVLHLLRQDSSQTENFGKTLIRLRNEIKYCSTCHNLSDQSVCPICSNPKRDKKTVCVVETVRDVMSIESTSQYNGLYHVLGGVISPMEGIGPSDLTIDALITRVTQEQFREVILAMSTTIEGDTTNYYLYKLLKPLGVEITTLARGLSVGDELEYADVLTLGRSLTHRTPFETQMH